ncbi:MAG: hypothetical protein BGO55_23240 [Sphingobacteriales bacterium 50-39]|nr:DUF4292 domain-containing protein [Sphingobacteriales bacterium]OJW58223.1 MAG: hypothetical protein BGO55_23240 [Sphingobacteriales bacterium 50-39]
MQKFLAVIAVVIALFGSIVSCRSTKKIQKVIAAPSTARKDTAATIVTVAPPEDRHADSLRVIQQAVNGLVRNRVNFQTFSSRMKVHYEGSDGKDYEFNAFIHIKKDSMIWVSINAALGIEAFRLLITPDSVKILDKLKKVARLRSVSFLQEEIHLPVDFRTVQDLLMGNPIYLDTTNILFYKKDASGISLLSAGDLFKNYLTLNGDNTIRHCKLDDVDPMRARTCDLTYGDYEQRDTLRFSTYRKISVAEKTKVDIELGYKQYKFNENLSFSFTIPKNYRHR